MDDIFSKGEEKHFKLTRMINTLLLMTHVCLLALFAYLHITLMVYVNIVSVSFYLFLFLVYKRNISNYVFAVYIEVMIHMCLATISVGWDGGFHFYSFCLIPCAFLCDYLSRTDGRQPMYPIPVSIIVMLLFLATRSFCNTYTALYIPQSPGQYSFLFAYNAVVSFTFLIIYMSIFGNRILSKEKQLESMAERDELTKLPNRYLMHQWLSESYLDSDSEHPMAIAMLDIDDFKKLNDTYGHECGDVVLKDIAGEINRISDENLKVSRWGGEEFVFLATGADAYSRLQMELEELRKRIEKKKIVSQNKPLHVTVTIGAAEYTEGDVSFQDTLKRADERLYLGKKRGKNCVVGKE